MARVMEFLAARGLRFWAAVAAAVFVLIVGLYVWASFAFVRVHYVAEDPVSADSVELSTATLAGEQDPSSIRTLFGISFVPRSATYIRLTSGDATTLVHVGRLPRFGREVTATLSQPRAVDKTGAGGPDCSLVSGPVTYGYHCTNTKAIVRYERPRDGRWRYELVRRFFPASRNVVRPYRDGLIGVAIGPAGSQAKVFHVRPRESSIASFDVPADLVAGGSAGSLTLATDSSDPSNRGFVVYNARTGVGRRYSQFSEAAGGEVFRRRHAYNPDMDTTRCLLRDRTVYCYTGQSTVPAPEGHDGEPKPGSMEVFPDGGDRAAQLFRAEDLSGVDQLLATAGRLYVRKGEEIHAVTLDDGTMRTRVISPRIRTAAAGAQLYWSTTSRLYRYDERNDSATLVFSGTNLTMSEITVHGADVTFNAFVRDDPAGTIHSYRVRDEPHTGPRLEDRLPYSLRGLPLIAMDYTTDRLYFQVRVAVISDKAAGVTRPDQAEFDAAKERVTERLREDGLVRDDLDLIFTY